MATKLLFLVAVGVCCSPWCSPPFALALGLAIGLLHLNPWPQKTSESAKLLLKLSVIGLGFGMNLRAVFEVGRTSFIYTGIGITAAMTFGLLAGRILRVPWNASFLISVGTSICGGSAIAAVCPVLDAHEDETAVSLSTVFVLNSIGLILFPLLGTAFGLTQTQFGLWAALAIHDTSSVVGAGLRYGAQALTVATTVKLVRSLWIVPVTCISAIFLRGKTQVIWPWFIAGFLAAAWLNSAVPSARPLWNAISMIGKTGFAVTLFLIGAGMSRTAVRKIGWRALALGVLLWVTVSCVTFQCIRAGWITM